MFLIIFFITFIFSNKFLFGLETIYVSNLSLCQSFCNGSTSENPTSNFFQALESIESRYDNNQNVDFQIILMDKLHIIDESSLKLTNIKFWDNEYRIYTFFSNFSNLNLKIIAANNQNPKIFIRTNNFTILFGKSLQIYNIGFYGNDMIFQENNYRKKLNLECIDQEKLCCKNSDLLGYSVECDFMNQNLNEISSNYYDFGMFSNENLNSDIEISLVNVFFEFFVGIAAFEIKFSSFIFVKQSNDIVIHLENVKANNCFFEKSLINFKEKGNFNYNITSLTITDYNSLNLMLDFFDKKSYFLKINQSSNAIIINLYIENSQHAFYFENNLNVSIRNLSIVNQKNNLISEFQIIFFDKHNIITISSIKIMSLSSNFRNNSIFFIGEQNKIFLEDLEISQLIFSQNSTILFFYGQNNYLSIYFCNFTDSIGNGTFIDVKNGNNAIELSNMKFFNISFILFDIRFNCNFSLNLSYFSLVSNEILGYNINFDDSNQIEISFCSFEFLSQTFSGLPCFFKINQNNLLFIKNSYFKHLYFSNIGLFYINQNNTVEINYTIFFDNIGYSTGSLYLNNTNNLKIIKTYFNSCQSVSDGGVISVIGSNNFIEISQTLFTNNSAYQNGAIGFFQNFNNISLFQCTFITQESKFSSNVFYLNSINLFKMKSCIVASNFMVFLKASQIKSIIFENNTMIKSLGTNFYDFDINNVTSFYLKNSTFIGNLTSSNAYFAIFLISGADLIIDYCFFLDLNILIDKLGEFFIINNIIVANSIFRNMISYSYDFGYLFQSFSYNMNFKLSNCSFYNISSIGQSEMLFFQSNNFIEISYCSFNNTNTLNSNIYNYPSTTGAAVFMSSFNYYVIFIENVFSGCTANNSLWGFLWFSKTTSIFLRNNIFFIDHVLSGTIFRMTFWNSMIFNDNVIYINGLNSIYQETNYSLFYIDNSNQLFMKNISVLFKKLNMSQTLSIQTFKGFLLSVNSRNIITIQNITFVNDWTLKLGLFSLIFLEFNNLFKIANCYFNNNLVSLLLVSNNDNQIFIIHSVFENFLNGIISSQINNEIIIKDSNINNLFGNTSSVFHLNYMNKLTLIETLIENWHSSNFAIIFSYNSNNIFLINSSFKNCESGGYGGVFYLSMNSHIFIYCSFVANLSSYSGGIGYIQNDNRVVVLNSSFTNISSLKHGGCFNLLSNNVIFFSDCNIYQTNSVNYAGFLISFSQNIIKISALKVNDSNAISNSGGLIYLIFNCSLQISNSYFTNINAEKESGGFIKADNLNIIKIMNTTFLNTTALKGGLIYLESSNLLIIYNTIGENLSSLLYGGTINSNYRNEIKLINSIFEKTEADLDGGFIYLTSENSVHFLNLFLKDSISNEGYGGGFYLDYNNYLRIENCSFLNVYAKRYGSFFFLRRNNWINSTGIVLKNSGNFNFENIIENNIIQSYANNTLLMKKTNISGDLSCTVVFSINNSRIFMSYANISHSQKIIISLFALDQSNLILQRIIIYFDYNFLFYAINSNLNITSIRKFSSPIRGFNQSYFILVSSLISLQNILFSSKQKGQKTLQIINSIDSTLFLKNVNIIEINNYNNVKLFEIVNCNLILKNSILAFNRQFSLKNSSNFDISFQTILEKKFSCTIKKSIFLGNEATKYSSSLNFVSHNSDLKINLLISRSSFLFNIGNLGGALFISNITSSTIQRNYFQRNKANLQYNNQKAKGGSIFCLIQSKFKSEMVITNNSFIKNVAVIGGALYIIDPYDQIIFSSNSFVENNALLYGSDLASDIHKLCYTNGDIINYSIPMINVISGHNYSNELIKIGGLDKFGNFLFKTDENFLQKFEIISSDELTNKFAFFQENGYVALKGILTRKELPISVKFDYLVRYNYFQTVSELKFTLNFLNCEFGERLNDQFQCIPCPVNTYLFKTDFSVTSESCKSCLTEPFNCYGGINIVPKEGYWRHSKISSNFIECFIESNCLGDNQILSISNYNELITDEIMKGICLIGYEGPLCSVCSSEYGKIDKFNCVQCTDNSYSVVMIIGTLIRVAFVIASVYYATQKCSAISRNSQKSIKKVFKSNLLKVMANHMQVLLIIYSFPFQWPSKIQIFFGYFFSISPNVAEGFSMECYVKQNKIDYNPIYLKLEFIAIYPLFLLLLSLLVLKAIKEIKTFYKECKKKKKQNKKTVINNPRFRSNPNKKQKIKISYFMKIICVFAIILYNCYQDIIKFFLQMFSCIEVGDPNIANFSEKRLLIDLSIDCNGNSHKNMIYFLVIPLLLFIGVLFPLILSFQLSKIYKKGDLNKPENLYEFGYFYYAYKRSYYYWDFVILGRKTILLFIYCIFFTGRQIEDIYPIFILLIVLIINLIIHIEIKPFDDINFNLLNVLEKYSLASLSMTIYLSLFLFTYLSNNAKSGEEFFFAIILIMGISNLIFFFKWMKVSFTHVIKPKVVTYINRTSIIINNIKNRLASRTTSAYNINSTTSVESIESDRKNLVIDKLRGITLDIIKPQKIKNEEEEINEIIPSLSSLKSCNSSKKKFRNKIILEEEEEDSPIKTRNFRRKLPNFELCDLNSKNELDELGIKIKEENLNKVNKNMFSTEEEIKEINQNFYGNILGFDENLENFEKYVKLMKKENQDNAILQLEKKDFILFSLENEWKYLMENENFSLKGKTLQTSDKMFQIKIYIKSYIGQFTNFEIKFEERTDILYKYEIDYLSADESPTKTQNNLIIPERIKSFFDQKDGIVINFYIMLLNLSYFEIFQANLIFKLKQKEDNFNILLDIPITFNKFINFTVNQLQESQRAINIYWKKKKCYLNLNIEKNKEIIQIIFPSCQFDQNEQEIKYYGNFSFCESLQFKNIFFYELVHNFDEKDSELKIGYEAEKADDQEILDLLLKKICNDYAVLISELLL